MGQQLAEPLDRFLFDPARYVALALIRSKLVLGPLHVLEMAGAGVFQLAVKLGVGGGPAGGRVKGVGSGLLHDFLLADLRHLPHQAHHAFAHRLGHGMIGRDGQKALQVV